LEKKVVETVWPIYDIVKYVTLGYAF